MMAPDSLLGETLDEYRLVALLGRGGMARVYRALDLNLKRLVAIKVIDTPYRQAGEYIARFRREAQTIAQLDHPNIVRLYRYGEVGDLLYMAMQYIHGVDLGYILASYRSDGVRIEPAEAIRIIGEVCQALDYAHSQGVIHRDVKPSNILLDQQGRAILTDFGLALLSEVGTRGQILGSPHYVSPEQALSSAKAVAQSDLYSLGVILYEMYTGRLPFDAPDPVDVALMHVERTPQPPREVAPDLSPKVEAVILRALAKKPEDRYASGRALAQALARALEPPPTGPVAAVARQTPSTISRLSVAERVRLQAAGAPEPAGADVPLTEGLLLPAPPVPSAPAAGARPSRPRSRLLPRAGAILAALLSLSVCALLAWAAGRGLAGFGALLPARTPSPPASASASPRATPGHPTATVIVTAVIDPATATATTTETSTATATATATPLPTATPERPLLLVVLGHNGESLFVINAGTLPLPLGPLRLGDGRSAVSGGEWGVKALAPSECVVILDKDGRKPVLPADVHCTLVGDRPVRSGNRRFWRSDYRVYYGQAEVGRCNGGEALCQVSWASEPN